MVAVARHDLLLLDFGGVCLLNPVELHAHVEQRLGLRPGTLDWMGPVDPATDELWREMVTGNGVSERDYWHRRAADVGRAAGRELSLADYMTLLFVPPRAEMVRPEAVEVVDRALAAGVGVSVLTNDLRAFHGRDWERGVELLQRVDHIIDASDTGVLKPDRRAYEQALAVTGTVAERVLFVDDQPRNVAGAEAVGMAALWFDVARPAASWAAVADRLGL